MISHEEMIGIVATEAVEAIHQSQQQQPKSEPSRDVKEATNELLRHRIAFNGIRGWHITTTHTELSDAIAAALQSKQDEINELRDKLKASQPTLPQPQTPHQ